MQMEEDGEEYRSVERACKAMIVVGGRLMGKYDQRCNLGNFQPPETRHKTVGPGQNEDYVVWLVSSSHLHWCKEDLHCAVQLE